MQYNLWLFFIPAGILLGLLGPQSVLPNELAELYDNQVLTQSGRVFAVSSFCFEGHGLVPVPAGTWHYGGNLQRCSPYLCPESFISSSFESSWLCKMSYHTSEADLLFLPVKPFSLSSFFLTFGNEALRSVTQEKRCISISTFTKSYISFFFLIFLYSSFFPPFSTPPPVIFLKHGPYQFTPSEALHCSRS